MVAQCRKPQATLEAGVSMLSAITPLVEARDVLLCPFSILISGSHFLGVGLHLFLQLAYRVPKGFGWQYPGVQMLATWTWKRESSKASISTNTKQRYMTKSARGHYSSQHVRGTAVAEGVQKGLPGGFILPWKNRFLLNGPTARCHVSGRKGVCYSDHCSRSPNSTALYPRKQT